MNGGVRLAGVRLALDRAHRDGPVLERVAQRARRRPRRARRRRRGVGRSCSGPLVEVLAGRQRACRRARPATPANGRLVLRPAALSCERGARGPSSGGDERHALALALDDDAGGDATAPGRRTAPADLLPQDRADLVAVEAVEDAAGLLGVDQAAVEVAGVVDGVADGLGGDLVEHHPLDRHLGVQHLEQVPRDGLALAILIRREVELVGVLQQSPSGAGRGPSCRDDDVERLEVVVDVDAEVCPLLSLVLPRAPRRRSGGRSRMCPTDDSTA